MTPRSAFLRDLVNKAISSFLAAVVATMSTDVDDSSRKADSPKLSKDVLSEIFSYLSCPGEFAASEGVSKAWREAGLISALWQNRVRRLCNEKILSGELRRMLENPTLTWKATYEFMLEDSKRKKLRNLEEFTEKIWSMRFLDTMGVFWLSKNPGPGKKPLLRRFSPDGIYWYPEDDPVFTDPIIQNTMPRQLNWVAVEGRGGVISIQLGDFPLMRLKRNHETWGWNLSGGYSNYTTIGIFDEEEI